MLDPTIADGTGCVYIGTQNTAGVCPEFMMFNEPLIHTTIVANTRDELLRKVDKTRDACKNHYRGIYEKTKVVCAGS